MHIIWEDRKGRGSIDGAPLNQKPVFSFAYAWLNVDDNGAQYVESHEPDVWNKELPASYLVQIQAFYSAYVFEGVPPSYDPATQKLVDSAATEVIEGKLYSTYDIVQLTQVELDAIYQASVPEVITMREARLVLFQNELLPTIDAAIAASTDEVLKIEWAYAAELRRDWPSLITMAAALGITDAALDAMFIQAKTL